MKPRKPPRVEVVWIDACDKFEQFTLDEARKQTLVERHTTGYLVHRDEERTIIAHDWDPPNEVCNVVVIPSGWVKQVRGQKPRVRKEAPSDPVA